MALTFPALVHAAEYSAGEVWSFRARPNEPNAKVIIVHVESSNPAEPVYFVYLRDVQLNLPKYGRVPSLGAIPITRGSLDQSVINLVGHTKQTLPYQAAYGAWKESLTKGKPWQYQIPLAEVLDGLERSRF